MEETGGRMAAYDLFVRIAKSMALKLPHEKDRVLAAKWIRKIDDLMDLDYPQKTKYLKLINISMQSKVLVGPFKNPPPSDDFDIQELYNMKPVDIKDMVTDLHRISIFRPNPYYAEISNDLKEYVVLQEIPEFGTHFYYACSLEPITEWRNNNFAIIPQGALEPSVIVPPLPAISASKEEFVKNYNLYAEKFNSCPKEQINECNPNPEEMDCGPEINMEREIKKEPKSAACPGPKRKRPRSKCRK